MATPTTESQLWTKDELKELRSLMTPAGVGDRLKALRSRGEKSMTPTEQTKAKQISKSGIALPDFEDITLYKDVPTVPPVTSLADAVDRTGNDEAELFSIITAGLQSKAEQAARSTSVGWKDEKGVDASELVMVNSEDLNPIVLQFAKLNYDYDLHQADVSSKDPARVEKGKAGKIAAKEAALEDIKGMPKVLAGLTRKAEQRMTAKA